jgi:hypothetical protein
MFWGAGFDSPPGESTILKPMLLDQLYAGKVSHLIQQNQQSIFLYYYFYLMTAAHPSSKTQYTANM